MASSRREKDLSNAWGRLIQVVALLVLGILVAIDLGDKQATIPAYIYGGLLGIAIGAKPEDIMRLRK